MNGRNLTSKDSNADEKAFLAMFTVLNFCNFSEDTYISLSSFP